MARSTNSKAEEMKIERKEQIMRAALKVFADHGVKLTKISMIAKEAGVSHGLVYHYFKSKDEVLYESIKWAVAMDKTRHFLEQLNETSYAPLEKIMNFTKYALSSQGSDSSNIFRIIRDMEEADGLPKDLKDFTDNLGMMFIEFLVPVIKEGQESGEIIQEDPDELVGVFLTIISGLMSDNDDFWQDNLDYKVDIFLRMLATR